MKINFNGIILEVAQVVSLLELIDSHKDFIRDLKNETYTCFVKPLGIPQNIVGEHYFELKKENDGLTLTKALIR
jgi:hypothetical protein